MGEFQKFQEKLKELEDFIVAVDMRVLDLQEEFKLFKGKTNWRLRNMTVWNPGEYITPDLVKEAKNGEIIVKVVKDNGLVQTNWGEKLEIVIELPDGKEKKWSMNATSYEAVKEKFGPDSKDWKDKFIRLYTENQKVGKEMKDVIYAKPFEQPEKEEQ
jgi:hypothetical protein